MLYAVIYKLPLLLIVYVQNRCPVPGWIAGWMYSDTTDCTVALVKIETGENFHEIRDMVQVIRQVAGVSASLFQSLLTGLKVRYNIYCTLSSWPNLEGIKMGMALEPAICRNCNSYHMQKNPDYWHHYVNYISHKQEHWYLFLHT